MFYNVFSTFFLPYIASQITMFQIHCWRRTVHGNGLQLATLLSRVVTPYEGLFNPLKRLLTICRDYVAVKSKLKHPPRAYPGHLTSFPAREGGNLEFDELSLPGGGEFDHYS